MSAHDPDNWPSPSDLAPDVEPPMFLQLHVCECGRVGERVHTRCGRNGRHNMSAYRCPTAPVTYIPMDDE